MKNRKVKQFLFGDGYQWKGECIKKGTRRVNKVEVFGIQIYKYNNETCEICSGKGDKVERRDKSI
jgi:hypothetical protein